MKNLPFDVSSHFDQNLRDIPNSPTDMGKAVNFLKLQLQNNDLEASQKLQIMGLIGVYSRVLHDFTNARHYLTEAVALSEQSGNEKSQISNQIRLAHVYQWEENYAVSDRMFSDAIKKCQTHPQLKQYLDFAYQHAGKNKFDQGKYTEALNLFQKALKIRLIKSDRELIDSTQLALEITQDKLGLETGD